MKVLVFVFFHILLAQALWDVILTNEEEACIKTLNLKRDKIIYLYFRHNTAEDIPQLNDFIHCVWKANAFQDEQGNVDYDKLIQQYDLARRIGEDDPEYLNHMRELVAVAVAECQKNPPSPGETAGQTAAEVQNCIVENYVKAKPEQK